MIHWQKMEGAALENKMMENLGIVHIAEVGTIDQLVDTWGLYILNYERQGLRTILRLLDDDSKLKNMLGCNKNELLLSLNGPTMPKVLFAKRIRNNFTQTDK